MKRLLMCGIAAATIATALAAPADASPYQAGGRRYVPPAIRVDPTPPHPSRPYPKPTITIKTVHVTGYHAKDRH